MSKNWHSPIAHNQLNVHKDVILISHGGIMMYVFGVCVCVCVFLHTLQTEDQDLYLTLQSGDLWRCGDSHTGPQNV